MFTASSGRPSSKNGLVAYRSTENPSASSVRTGSAFRPREKQTSSTTSSTDTAVVACGRMAATGTGDAIMCSILHRLKSLTGRGMSRQVNPGLAVRALFKLMLKRRSEPDFGFRLPGSLVQYQRKIDTSQAGSTLPVRDEFGIVRKPLIPCLSP